jgi:PE-PPE domain
MRSIRALLSAGLAAVALVAGMSAPPLRVGYRLTATYAVKGTQIIGFNITSDAAIKAQAMHFIEAVYGPAPTPVTALRYPASIPLFSPGIFAPGIDESIATGVAHLQTDTATDAAPVIFGYSQGGAVVSEYKRAFNAHYADPGPDTAIPHPTFVMIGNIERPGGGFYERFAGLHVPFFDLTALGATPTQTAGATAGQLTTYDISGQYDPVSDFPAYPLNVLADLNSALGFIYVHLNYSNLDMSSAVLQAQVGDTDYLMIPSTRLPLLLPLRAIGVPDPILAALDAPLRVLVEAGYDRTVSPGQPTTAKLLPAANIVTVLNNFLTAIPTGIDDGLQEAGLGRPFHTKPAGPYGVGGPSVTVAPHTSQNFQARTTPQVDRSHATSADRRHRAKTLQSPEKHSQTTSSTSTPPGRHAHTAKTSTSAAGRTAA